VTGRSRNRCRRSRSAVAAAFFFLLARENLGCKAAPVRAAPELSAVALGPKTVKFDPHALERLGVRVQPAGHVTADHALVVAGTLEYDPDRYAEIGTPLEGRVTSIRVRVGDPIRKGQTLATVLIPSIASAQSEYLGAEAAASIAQDHVKRESMLLDKQLTTAREAEVARGEAIRSGAELEASKAKLQALGIGVPARGASIEAAGTLALKSPLTGVVVAREAVVGTFLRPDEKAFAVADLSGLRATLDIFESDLPLFHVGSEVELLVDALPGTVIKGRLAGVEPGLGKATRVLKARIDVPNHDGRLRPGLFLRAAIELPTQVAGENLFVPAAAVQPLGDGDVVFVQIEPGKFEVRGVRIARRTAQVVQVEAGLSSGEPIAVEGAFLLRGEVTKQ
jgi:cobalt-zinc-cadmium efflux system membrane fusion protein